MEQQFETLRKYYELYFEEKPELIASCGGRFEMFMYRFCL